MSGGQRARLDVLTFGEAMLRLTPKAAAGGRLEGAVAFEVHVGGAEANVAVALARLGSRSTWLSRLPRTPLGRRIESEIRGLGADTSHVVWEDAPSGRVGIYFLDTCPESGETEVFYDRAGSSASRLAPEDIDPDLVGAARLLHVTGITPALSDSCAAAVHHAIGRARARGVAVSFDVNYRAKLWTPDVALGRVGKLIREVDLLICPQRDAKRVFGIGGDGPEIAQTLRAEYGVGVAVVTCGAQGAAACGPDSTAMVPARITEGTVDALGAGDAFAAGVLFGFLRGDVVSGLDYGVAMAALKRTIRGDFLTATPAEIEAFRLSSVSAGVSARTAASAPGIRR